ncbi:MAG: hypothetical protein K2X27_14995 [Candidatus Obscuribacterales bacterium]|nr:hypothetical protein [Candidatus Obscuribacterales bacterium]
MACLHFQMGRLINLCVESGLKDDYDVRRAIEEVEWCLYVAMSWSSLGRLGEYAFHYQIAAGHQRIGEARVLIESKTF